MTSICNHPAYALWHDPRRGLVVRIRDLLLARALHPARCVVLLPYAQLMAVAQSAWANGPGGFMPRFETTRNWAHARGGFAPSPGDLAFDTGRDLQTAQALLARTALVQQRRALAPRLLQAARQLAPLAAAQAPWERATWGAQLQHLVGGEVDSPWFAIEARLTHVALAWVASSAYATDLLFHEDALAEGDAMIVLEGLQVDPLTQALALRFGAAALRISLPEALAGFASAHAPPPRLHAALDPEDEAECAAACVLQHLAQGHAPVALVATDRAQARRIGALLANEGVAPHDETGWKLSTTRAAAALMTTLRACMHDASCDAVLDWLKHAPALQAAPLRALEARLRRHGVRDWAAWCASIDASRDPGDHGLRDYTRSVQDLRVALGRARDIAQWQAATRSLLQASGQWSLLAADVAGAEVIRALALEEGAEIPGTERCALADFVSWVRDVLEEASAVLSHTPAGQAPVVVLPLAQLLARPFGAVVLPAADEQHLPLSPDSPGDWSTAQRAALGLPARAALEVAQQAAWQLALQAPRLDLLWRRFDAGGEPVRASGFVQRLQVEGRCQEGADPRATSTIAARPTPHPLPQGAALPITTLSATAYEDLRRCPYRFFALHQLSLRHGDELDAALDKRDFGTWLHDVLRRFHLALQAAPTSARAERVELIDNAAGQASTALALPEAEFLPFAAAWPAVRDAYLDWLQAHEDTLGARFDQAEVACQQGLGAYTLVGRIDRIDRLSDGSALVLDYKSESLDKSRARIREPGEDTQLAFYAALLDEDSPRAAYVNVGELSSGTHLVELPDAAGARDALVEGIQHDLQRIAAGAALPALGEGTVCEHCDARGLCRRDFWSDGA